MSWSISKSGSPEDVAKELDQHSTTLTGQSKVEYDDALPHLKALVLQNFGQQPRTIQISANGSGMESGGQQINRSCSVTLKS